MIRLTGKWKDDYIPYNSTNQQCLNKLGKLEDLAEKVGCPLEVRCKIVPNSYIYTFGTSMKTQDVVTRRKVITISKKGIYISYTTASGKERGMTLFWKEYKKNWWLKPDKSK